jgi:hypothetical protein
MPIWHTISTYKYNKYTSSLFGKKIYRFKFHQTNELKCIKKARRSNQFFELPQSFRGLIALKFHCRLGGLALLYRRQFLALAEHKACITRNDHRDIEGDAEPLAVAMWPGGAYSGPDTALLPVEVVILIDNVVKIVCWFVFHILLFEIDKKFARSAL